MVNLLVVAKRTPKMSLHYSAIVGHRVTVPASDVAAAGTFLDPQPTIVGVVVGTKATPGKYTLVCLWRQWLAFLGPAQVLTMFG